MRLSNLLFLVPLALLVSACSSTTDEEPGDVGDVSEALSTPCRLSRGEILSSAGSTRKSVLERGFTWLDADVPYSQSRFRDDYRTDCSGFVSMAWDLGTSYTTADFSAGNGESHRLGAFGDLAPGDALVRRSSGSGHIVLFLGWNDASKSAACVLEQASTAADMQFRSRTSASLKSGGYKAIRADKLKNAPAGGDGKPPVEETEPEAGNPDGGVELAPPGEKTCRGDGDCNPGNNGAGLVCTDGKCVPGCRSDAQCPGSKRCAAGQCGP